MGIKVFSSALVLLSALVFADASSSNVDWKKLIPAIRALLKTDPHARVEERGVGIVRKADITGDGLPEALVMTGGGGAYTSDLTVVRIEDGKPVLARFKGKDGTVSSLYFSEGSSAMHGVAVEMVPEKHALYSGHWDTGSSGKALRDCSVDAYQWNGPTKTFDFSPELSTELRDRFCRDVSKELIGN